MYRNIIKSNTVYLLLSISIVTVALVLVVLIQRASAQVPPETPAAGSTLDQRVEQRKAERSIELPETDEKRTANVCMAAQTKIREVQGKTAPAADNRVKVDQQIDAKLWIMIGKLKIAGKDTYDLETHRTALTTKMEASQEAASSYAQVLDDTVAVDCKSDPAGFKALLETARIYQTQLRDLLTDQRSYINNEVKNSLNSYASDLKSKSGTN